MKHIYTIPIYRLSLVRDGQAEATAITCPDDIVLCLTDIATADREHVVCLYLDCKNKPIGKHVISIGNLNASLIHPREVFKGALLANAHSIILAHNHPSGDVTPSRDDTKITQRIARAGALLGVALLDHVILSPDGTFYSYQNERPGDLKEGTDT